MILIRLLFKVYSFRSYQKFVNSFSRPVRFQNQILKDILKDLKQTDYGQTYKIHGKESREQFRSKLPIVSFDDITSQIEKQKTSKQPILVKEKIVVYEPTSGSRGSSKHIPITKSLRQSFEKMFLLWLYDLFCSPTSLKFKTGRVFMSVSSSLKQETDSQESSTSGFEDDSDYLGPLLKWVLNKYLVVPLYLKKIKDPFQYKRVLCAYLAADKNLEVISVWNPTYLTSLFEFAQENKDLLMEDLRAGFIKVENHNFSFSICKEERLRYFAHGHWSLLWQNLKLISCWTDHTAQKFAAEIEKHFPNVSIQGKGLLATEAPMTMPLLSAKDPLPLLSEVFFEFEDENGKLYFVDEIRKGKIYQIIITQKGGLIRYRMGDQVSVNSFYKNTPCLRFQGRSRSTSDMVGEKLNENFLMNIWDEKLPFWVLVPQMSKSSGDITPNYKLFVDGHQKTDENFEEELEKSLCASFHYNHARRMSQLKPLQVEMVPELKQKYFLFHEKSGMKTGDIKYNPLLSNLDQAKDFEQQVSQENNSPTL